MVGLAVACGLQGSGLRVAVLDHVVPSWRTMRRSSAFKCRRHAAKAKKTAYPSWRMVKHCGAISGQVATTVWKSGDKDSFGRITFDDASMGYSHLGGIVENSVIHYALWRAASGGYHPMAPAERAGCPGENDAFLTLRRRDVNRALW